MVKVLLYTSLLLAGALAQQHTGDDVLLTMPVTIDGSLKNLQLLRGESFEDAATSFARSNGLMDATDDPKVQAVVEQLSGLLKDKMHEVEAQGGGPQTPKEPMPSVQLSIPLTIDGFTGDLLKYETETPEAAVERFLYASGFSMDVMREVYPQLVTLVNRKLEELQPPRKELFAFTLSLDGKEIVVRHFEQGIPMEEAVETLRGVGVSDGEFMDRVAPQIANQIANEIAKRQQPEGQKAPSSTAPVQDQQQEAPQSAEEPMMQQQPPQRREVFSEPLTLNNQPAVMVHYEGFTAKETAMRFLGENGITDEATIETLVPQLVEIVDARMAALLQQEEQATAQAVAEAQRLQQQQRRPLISVPIQLGDQNQASLEYFEGDNVEGTVQRFLVGVGLSEGEQFNSNVVQLSALVRERLAALDQQRSQETEQAQGQASAEQTPPTQPEPMFVLPVTLSGNVFNLEYFEGQEPKYVANKFCVEKHEIMRAELGAEFDGDQLLSCQNVLVETIRNIITEGQQEKPIETHGGAEAQAQPEAPVQAEAEADPRGVLMFTLDIDMGDGTSVQLPVHKNDDPSELASTFCTANNLDQDNVPALVDAIADATKGAAAN